MLRARRLLAGSVVTVAVLGLWFLVMREASLQREPVQQLLGLATSLAFGAGAAAWVTRS